MNYGSDALHKVEFLSLEKLVQWLRESPLNHQYWQLKYLLRLSHVNHLKHSAKNVHLHFLIGITLNILQPSFLTANTV